MAFLELGKVRHSLELLRAEQESADKILQVTTGRESEGFELSGGNHAKPNSLKLKWCSAFCSWKIRPE